MIRRFRLVGGLVLASALALPALAQDPPTIPTTGVEFGGLVTAAVGVVGTAVAAVVAAYFAFLAVRIGMSWAGKIGGR